MIPGLRRKHKPLIGIDIGSTSVKLIELSAMPVETSARYRVEHFAIEPLPPTAMAEKKIADAQQVGKAIAQAVLISGARGKRAAVAVSGSAVITKVLAMDANLDESDMEAQIEFDAEQYIPFPLEEVNLDFQIVRPSPGKPGMVDVLLVATRRENVEDRVVAMEVAELIPAVVDVEAYAMENACSLLFEKDEEAHQTIAVVDIGAATTTLHVLHEGQIVYSREQNFGGQQLVDEVRRRYGLTREAALRKLAEEDPGQDYKSEVLGPFKDAVAQQIGRALQFFYSGTSYNRVDLVTLAGRPAGAIEDIDRLVAERLGLETRIANPFRGMSLAPTVDTKALMREAPGMMVAVGLALRGFD